MVTVHWLEAVKASNEFWNCHRSCADSNRTQQDEHKKMLFFYFIYITYSLGKMLDQVSEIAPDTGLP